MLTFLRLSTRDEGRRVIVAARKPEIWTVTISFGAFLAALYFLVFVRGGLLREPLIVAVFVAITGSMFAYLVAFHALPGHRVVGDSEGAHFAIERTWLGWVSRSERIPFGDVDGVAVQVFAARVPAATPLGWAIFLLFFVSWVAGPAWHLLSLLPGQERIDLRQVHAIRLKMRGADSRILFATWSAAGAAAAVESLSRVLAAGRS
ncbi:MAG: hypothetical protein HY720_30575 [Planctomycetes bacterium]|nr:hypothetical protein [Planctomycetota bacterium]